MTTQHVIKSLPPGFTDRYMRGPCNVECAHPDCPTTRAELRAYAETKLRRWAAHQERRRLLR